jgi:hypothetical protein
VKLLHAVNFLETKCRLGVLALCGGIGALVICGCSGPLEESEMGENTLGYVQLCDGCDDLCWGAALFADGDIDVPDPKFAIWHGLWTMSNCDIR